MMTLETFFQEHPRVALAFSGGVDSAYLLYAARACGAQVRAYYVQTAFQPAFEREDALRLARELGVEMTIVPLDILDRTEICANPPERCYHCKRAIFSAILYAAAADGFDVVIDGTNATDDAGDRPGMRALRELCVRSPLRECGLTKAEIRARSREAGLFTWDKPAYACLATRIPTGETITAQKLAATEAAEAELARMGFSDFRVRLLDGCARIQVRPEQLTLVMERREEIIGKLKQYYRAVVLDLEVRGE